MKIAKTKLKQIIKEEIEAALKEGAGLDENVFGRTLARLGKRLGGRRVSRKPGLTPEPIEGDPFEKAVPKNQKMLYQSVMGAVETMVGQELEKVKKEMSNSRDMVLDLQDMTPTKQEFQDLEKRVARLEVNPEIADELEKQSPKTDSTPSEDELRGYELPKIEV